MHRLRARSRTRDMMALGGWLFADLFLALAMLFFTTNVNVKPTFKPSVLKTPIPTPTLIPTLTPLELKQERIQITIDAGGVLQDAPDAINNVKQQMRGQAFLQGRSVGLVIVYGGAPTTDMIPSAQNVAQKIYEILGALGKEWTVFNKASYYDSLYILGGDFNTVTLDIYLFAKA